MLSQLEIEKNKQEFLNLLMSVKREGIDNVVAWLTSDKCDFFIAPA